MGLPGVAVMETTAPFIVMETTAASIKDASKLFLDLLVIRAAPCWERGRQLPSCNTHTYIHT